MRMSGLASSEAATASSTPNDSGLSAERPVSKFTPRRIRGAGVRSSVNRIGQPTASTRVPAAVPGHLSFWSSTPSASVSFERWHPTASTSTPAGVLGQRSNPSKTPSLSPSVGQPVASTMALAGVLGHWSTPSGTASASASVGQPRPSTRAPAGVAGHWSRPSYAPSLSASSGHPAPSVWALAGVPQASAPIVVGSGTISDTATLAGGYNPTGTITFNLYGPNDASCATSIFSSAA